MGIESLVLCSEADKDNPYVKEASDFKIIGPPPPKESYLNVEKVLDGAVSGGAEAIHPGYGFLSEDHEFAKKVKDRGLVFIGPDPKWLEVMGDKVKARELMGERGLPLSPSTGVLSGSVSQMASEMEKLGFPLLIKPAGGGGGIGMIPVLSKEKLEKAIETASSMAKRSFGKSELYAERYLESPRHVEFQIVADGLNAVHLFDRDCSTQRRNQKVVEEACAPNIPDDSLLEMANKAASILSDIGYDHLATVETLYSESTGFGFLEVNPRLQVEHAITEEITGVDLVSCQLMLAMNKKVEEIFPKTPQKCGHAIEARIYAEDSKRFLPSPGTLKVFSYPFDLEGVRVETGFQQGSIITPFYDPMIAQVIARGETRLQAISRLSDALSSFEIEGLKTNIPFLLALMKFEPFLQGNVNTGVLDALIKSPGYNV
jgi:acetyl-CoA carboxylase biotin carboxylase subunit